MEKFKNEIESWPNNEYLKIEGYGGPWYCRKYDVNLAIVIHTDNDFAEKPVYELIDTLNESWTNILIHYMYANKPQ